MSVKDAKRKLLKLIKKYEEKGKPLWRSEINRKLHLNPITFKRAVEELKGDGEIRTEISTIKKKSIVIRERQVLLFKSKDNS